MLRALYEVPEWNQYLQHKHIFLTFRKSPLFVLRFHSLATTLISKDSQIWTNSDRLTFLYRARANRPAADDDSHSEEEVNLMTDQQKEEEAMFK